LLENSKLLENSESKINPIDFIFGSIDNSDNSLNNNNYNNDNNDKNDKIEKNDKNDKLDKNDNDDKLSLLKNVFQNSSNNDYLKQIYPPLNSNNSLMIKNVDNQIYTNMEIKTKIDKLSENEMFEIFKIIKNKKEKYSTNNNGIFINLSTLKKLTITEICNFLNFCDNNNIIFDNEEKTRDIYREMLL
jgi:hypothetical protein